MTPPAEANPSRWLALARSPWAIAVATLLLIHVFAFPVYFHLSPAAQPCPECCDLQAKIDRRDHLLSSVQDRYPAYYHMAKTEFRLTPPLLFKLAGITAKPAAYVLQLALGLVFFATAARLFHEITEDPVLTPALTLALGLIYTGFAFVVDVEGFLDPFGWAFLALCLDRRLQRLIPLFALLAFFTDERAVIAAGLLTVWYQLDRRGEPGAFALLKPTRSTLLLLLGLLLYGALRMTLVAGFGFKNQTAGTGLEILRFTLPLADQTLWQMLEGFWLFVALALAGLWRERRDRLLLLLLPVAAAAVYGVALLVEDLTRSAAYGFPALFIALRLAKPTVSRAHFRTLGLLCLLICVLYPPYAQIARKSPRYFAPLYVRIGEKLAGS